VSIKNAFKEIQLWKPSTADESFYDGSMMNFQRCGFGKLMYNNGIKYEGEFRAN